MVHRLWARCCRVLLSFATTRVNFLLARCGCLQKSSCHLRDKRNVTEFWCFKFRRRLHDSNSRKIEDALITQNDRSLFSKSKYHLSCSLSIRGSLWNRKSRLDFVQRLGQLRHVQVHAGCVNSITWNSAGTRLLSGSDDQRLLLCDPLNHQSYSCVRTKWV